MAEEVRRILAEGPGEERGEALTRLMPLVFEDLRRMARSYFAREAPGHTLQPTAVVNEVYLRLAGSRLAGIESRGQFFGIASRLIREVLVDYARARRADKRGGGAPRVELDEADGPGLLPKAAEPETLLAVHEALRRLERIDRRQSRVVELRYFAGLTQQEVADLMGLSLATVERDWMVARHWLAREIGGRAA